MPIEFDDTTNESAEYAAFVDKFKPKKTTDDCYTPPNVYEAVLSWAVNEYHLEGRPIIRPFYPGGDYENADYPEGCVVIDNPPFSIISQICRFYEARGIDYFMFGPHLTLFSTNAGRSNYVLTGVTLTYANGAKVNTGFVTNLGTDRVILSSSLRQMLKEAEEKNTKSTVALPKYDYPDHVITPATLGRVIARDVDFRVPRESAVFIRALDHQRENRKACFGGAFLLSDRLAQERAEADRLAQERAEELAKAQNRWRLSEREREIIAGLRDAEEAGE